MTVPDVVASTRHRRSTGPWWRVVAALLLVATVTLAGCSSSSSTDDAGSVPAPGGTDQPDSADRSTPTSPEGAVERTGIDGDFGEVAVTITAADGETCELCLLLADTGELRSQGLMGVTDPDLGGYDGMLFDHGGASSGGYWMKNTPMPLSIAFWDEDGNFVSSVDMEPCIDEPVGGCPSYPAAAPFRLALEVPQGGLEEILATEGATLTVDDTTCALLTA